MALKVKEFTVSEELNNKGDANRDKGKTFIITEMAAKPAASFSRRVIRAIARSGYIPDTLLGEGIVGMGDAGFAALFYCNEADELLDELFACAKYKTPAGIRDIIDSDIEEASTYNSVQLEAYKLIVGFSPAAPTQS